MKKQQTRINATNTVRDQFDLIRHTIEAVAIGRKPMQMIGSDPGLGKTYLTRQILHRAGINIEEVAPANPAAFVKTLYDHRNAPVLVLDDCDALARSEVVAGIAKMAWGPTHNVIYDTVEARRNQQRADEYDEKYDEHIPPQQFRVRCRLIWLTNTDFTKSTNVEKKMHAHLRALVSRGLDPLWVDARKPQELLDYCVWLATDGNMLRSLGLSKAVSEEAVRWFIENRNRLTEITPRALSRAAMMMKSMGDDRRMLRMLLSPKDMRRLPPVKIPTLVSGGRWQ